VILQSPKKICLFALCLFIATACAENSAFLRCDDVAAVEGIPWLEELAASLDNCTLETSIVRGTYRNQTVFYTAITDPAANHVMPYALFNCVGDRIASFGLEAAQQEKFRMEVIPQAVIYTCRN
jgi:hypothetical protein